MYFGPLSFSSIFIYPFWVSVPSSSTPFSMVNRVYTQMAATVHPSQNSKQEEGQWVRGDTGFSLECASRTAGREAGALGTEFTWDLESQELNEKHMKKPIFKEPPTELHSWIPIYKPYIWDRSNIPILPPQCSFHDEQVSRAMIKISSGNAVLWGYLIQDAGMNMH